MKKFFLVLSMFFVFSGTVFAHAPYAIKLSYDINTHVLKADIKHPTQNMIKHHIRLVEVYKNGQKIESEYVPRQVSPLGYNYEKKIDAKPGDVLKVKAFSTYGGWKEESITITKPDTAKTKK